MHGYAKKSAAFLRDVYSPPHPDSFEARRSLVWSYPLEYPICEFVPADRDLPRESDPIEKISAW